METRSQLISEAEAACEAGDVVNAQRVCSIYQKQFGEDPDILYLTGRTFLNLRQYKEAEEALEQSYKQSNNNLALAYLIIASSATFNRTKVEKNFSKLALNTISHFELLMHLGHSLSALNLYTQALQAFTSASIQMPQQVEGYYHAGLMLTKLGKVEQAVEVFTQGLSYQPDHHLTLYALAQTKPDYFEAQKMTDLLQQSAHSETSRELERNVVLAHTLAKVYAYQGAYKQAEDILLNARAKFESEAEISEAKNAAIFDWLLDGKRENCFGSIGCASRQPIFVVGMPASGLDKIAQIISSHPDVAPPVTTNLFVHTVSQLVNGKKLPFLDLKTMLAAEELDNLQIGEGYINATAGLKSGDEKYTVDFQPYNFFNVSLIKRALPNAKIIIVQRDPLESVVLNFLKLQWPFNQSNGYSYDLTYCCRYYRHFHNLMLRWKTVFGDSIKVQSYTSLRCNFDEEVEALFNYCGLSQVDKKNQSVQTRLSALQDQLGQGTDVNRYKRFVEIVETKLSDIITD
ncbi:sulfotransferase [Alteromonas ponticola]|uniref:Sulfotransferase n=1 Tax=Alteromonas aquimaris TaxID=2998417 RepID=A0ABT3P5C5_9ALTE|nr:tetratricopeptide repeat-containing sulfotransferase family protein [Alteromonas aquimaris]MCW8107969.1 sulfotransferase [Alteromonas aquimaris]